jgi:hypothetical protein
MAGASRCVMCVTTGVSAMAETRLPRWFGSIWAQVGALGQAPVGGLKKEARAGGQHAMRRLVAEKKQCAVVLRRFPPTPMRSATLAAFRGRTSRRAVSASNPKACQPSRLHESLYQTVTTRWIGWRWYRKATSPVISDLPLVRTVAGELAAAAKVRLRRATRCAAPGARACSGRGAVATRIGTVGRLVGELAMPPLGVGRLMRLRPAP